MRCTDRRLPTAESIPGKIGIDRVSPGEFETSESPSPEGRRQLASSLDDQLADLAELVMSTQRADPNARAT
jgi:hypothetical protein